MRPLAVSLLLLFALFIPSAHAGPGEKLGRGITNIALSPGEYALQIMKAHQKDYNLASMAMEAVVYGTGNFITRLAIGLYETFTFPLDDEPILDPPTVFHALRQMNGEAA